MTLHRVYRVCGPTGIQYYQGFDAFLLGADYALKVGERTFFCDEAELALAVCEVGRYAKEQYDWSTTVEVTPMPSALEYRRA